jgi:rhamnopyranosyl-N-acetylglucosaminyl-diphospho-decaprenol beta-1,3/1,4-galactofuranosyltransferase
MRLLAHIIAFNDAAVIEQLLEGLRRQTRAPDAILIVDNASTDGTLNRTFPEAITVFRNSENLGPSGAVGIAFAHALEHGFDWTWVLDADSVPAPDALEKLLAFFDHLPTQRQEQVCFVAGWPLTDAGGVKEQPLSLERAPQQVIPLSSVRDFTQCDSTLWSGALYRMAAVARIGLPAGDYVADMGEIEYGYRARQLGFISFIVHNSVIHHDVGRDPGVTARLRRFGPISLVLVETSPWRSYYSIRNKIYFWLYQYRPRSVKAIIRTIVEVIIFTFSFAVRPFSHHQQLAASIRGILDGLTGNMTARY